MKLCPKCESPIDGANVYCRYCYAEYRRKQRLVDKDERIKHRARAKAQRAVSNGLIFKHNCALCKSENSEMHHPDYSKPLDVIWLCEPCHNHLHSLERKAKCA